MFRVAACAAGASMSRANAVAVKNELFKESSKSLLRIN
jgi:hypothetical protein